MGDVIELVARERTYSGREVAEMLGIGASTLRKWGMLLEQHGYWFLRDNQNRREYRQMDVSCLTRFYELTKDQLIPQEEAAQISSAKTTRERERLTERRLLLSPLLLIPSQHKTLSKHWTPSTKSCTPWRCT
ncbi:hypothetical protein ABE205_23370 [Brevibacillus agri]|uniref:hypothetical protein n=1 Tax=Brevibacillus agri TaxID=51101 RepID=UPI003D2502D8